MALAGPPVRKDEKLMSSGMLVELAVVLSMKRVTELVIVLVASVVAVPVSVLVADSVTDVVVRVVVVFVAVVEVEVLVRVLRDWTNAVIRTIPPCDMDSICISSREILTSMKPYMSSWPSNRGIPSETMPPPPPDTTQVVSGRELPGCAGWISC